jgi:hypothetical protein
MGSVLMVLVDALVGCSSFLPMDQSKRGSVWRSAFGVWRSQNNVAFIFFVVIICVMDDFEQFDAFQRCREFVREFSQFVSIAKGSVGETRGQLLYAFDFGYLERQRFDQLNELGRDAARCLGGLMRHLNNSKFRGRKFKKDSPVP